MSDEQKALILLRCGGPMSIAAVKRHFEWSQRRTYSAVYRLREKRLAERLGPAEYDATGNGFHRVKHDVAKGLF